MKGRKLILCIDRDDDIGKKTGVETPILGREQNLEAAAALALSDPEEADANAMFAAVKLLDQLSSSDPKGSYEVATIAGSPLGGVEADRRIVEELETLLRDYPASSVILVTDGYSDESIIPLIQSRVAITSIQHVVVKHSERIEETWAVFFRYLKMLVNDPRYSRLSLGVPGIMLIALGVLILFNQLENAGMVLTFLVGAALLLKGFGLDERLAMMKLKLPPPEKQITTASMGAGATLTIVGLFLGVTKAMQYVPEGAPLIWSNFAFWLQLSPMLLGAFMLRAVDFVIMGIMVSLIGGAASCHMQRDPKIRHYLAGMVTFFWLRFITVESAKVLLSPEKILTLWSPLVLISLLGVVTTILTVIFLYKRMSLRGFERSPPRVDKIED
jgi:putative membrane protein